MGQTANVIPPKGLWTLKLKDFLNGVYLAVLPQLYVMLDFWANSDHFPTAEEWKPYLKAGGVIFFGYLLKNASTNNVGEVLTKDKPVVTIEKEKLDELTTQAEIPKTKK